MGDGKNLTRRGFIAGGAVAGAAALVATPYERLLNALSTGFIHQAQAEATGNLGARNYINILIAGGPMRYTFDAWMRTNPSDAPLEFNPMVATKFVRSGNNVVGTEYATFNYNGVMVPHMFSQSVTTSAGAKALTELLNNMLVIRGFGTGFDGHPFNATVQQAPVGGVSSVMGLAADYSQKTFEAVEWPQRGAYGNYASMNGKALNILTDNPLKSLLEGFGGPAADRAKGRSLKDRNREAFDLAQARLRAYSQSEFAGSTILSKNLSNASDLMKKGIGNIGSYWDGAVARYRSVIEASMRQQGLVGINDVAMISSQNELWRVHVADGNRGLVVSSDSDLRDSIKTMTSPGSLAEGLALAEYVLKEGLVSTMNLQMGDPDSLMFKDASNGVTARHMAIKDMHETGAIPGVLITTAYYRGLCAGMLELIEQLKKSKVNGVDLWSETVIQVISEFNRTARTNGSGSDHGFNQMVTSVFSGAIQRGPFVVGNIYRAGHGGGYVGTQGRAAPIDGYNQKGMPSPTMAASTVTALLRVPKNPYENLAEPLIRLNGDQLQILKAAKLVG
ncbi:twin-arginine translocation signal domain-containing protein [Bdellovibrio bacteriovorus]|uniref:twin-arginine translocation signal domain-containing protein n=1 Tax=Bdellovibrio bacteriovorus TaxID=959 RepID=UPI003AA80A37